MFVAQVTGKCGSIIRPLLTLFEDTELLTEQNDPYLLVQPHIKFKKKLLR
jgi:hypothetical protein